MRTIRGRFLLEIRARDGGLLARRRADNAVMRNGATLVAKLFAGQLKTGITHMGVGTSDTPETDEYATAALSNPDGPDRLAGDTETAIPAAMITVDLPDPVSRTVKVRLRATLPAAAAVGTVREAGLLSRSGPNEALLYNRVTFAPVQKGDDHELTMFWEVSFPYGDLQELL